MKSDDYCAVLWDPSRAKERGVKLDQEEGEDDIISELPSNIREEALVRLSECDYDVNAFQSTLSCIKPSDGSDWTQAKKDKFRDEIFRFRKHLPEVAKSLRVPMNTCLTYYLGTYKSSDDYRLLKTVCVEERTLRMEASERGYDACAICGDGGNLLICDGCEGVFGRSYFCSSGCGFTNIVSRFRRFLRQLNIFHRRVPHGVSQAGFAKCPRRPLGVRRMRR